MLMQSVHILPKMRPAAYEKVREKFLEAVTKLVCQSQHQPLLFQINISPSLLEWSPCYVCMYMDVTGKGHS
jgi:hypothetical protein